MRLPSLPVSLRRRAPASLFPASGPPFLVDGSCPGPPTPCSFVSGLSHLAKCVQALLLRALRLVPLYLPYNALLRDPVR